jgi:hypothetical protein
MYLVNLIVAGFIVVIQQINHVKQFLLAYRDENGKTKYKPVIGKATDLV